MIVLNELNEMITTRNDRILERWKTHSNESIERNVDMMTGDVVLIMKRDHNKVERSFSEKNWTKTSTDRLKKMLVNMRSDLKKLAGDT